MRTILIIEDDPAIANLVSYNLEQEGFSTATVSNGDEGLKRAKKLIPDAIILDLMLPKMSDLDVCRELRRSDDTKGIPIIMLTAKSEEIDRIVGFEVGADDYLTKPFSTRELVLRIKSLLKRRTDDRRADPLVKFRDLVIDEEKYTVTIGKRPVSLTNKEFKLLNYLVKNKGRVIQRDKILDDVWGYSSDVFSRTVDTFITRLKSKIGAYSRQIETVRGVGYIWKEK